VDLLFVDGISKLEDFCRVREGVQGRLVASIVEVNAPAQTRAEELEAMGYSVAIYALSGILAAAGGLDRLMADIKQNGHTDRSFESMMSYGALNDLLGIEGYHRMWERFPGT
jgi:2-methylisocitrate lyase-like PEP mutase family enzyme